MTRSSSYVRFSGAGSNARAFQVNLRHPNQPACATSVVGLNGAYESLRNSFLIPGCSSPKSEKTMACQALRGLITHRLQTMTIRIWPSHYRLEKRYLISFARPVNSFPCRDVRPSFSYQSTTHTRNARASSYPGNTLVTRQQTSNLQANTLAEYS